VAVGEAGTFGVDVGSTFIGLTALLVSGYGWIQFSDKDGFQSKLSLPICDACRHHATARERASIISGAAGLGSLFLSMAVIRPHSAKEGLQAVGVGLVVFVVATIVQAILGKRPEPPCCGTRPVGLVMRDERFTITFGNPAFGHRVAAMNPRVLE